MQPTIAFSVKRTLEYVEGGGHLWVFLNWALALRALGCRVIWLEVVKPRVPPDELPDRVRRLRDCLRQHGIERDLVLYRDDQQPLPLDLAGSDPLSLETAADQADLLLNLRYDLPPAIRRRFGRAALIDIDPGLTQLWISEGQLELAAHDLYFTIGETVGTPQARFPDCGLEWHFTPPPVHLPAWPVAPANSDAPFTTVTHWGGAAIRHGGRDYPNGKREGFLPFIDLPRQTPQPLELATYLWGYEPERQLLREHGWRIVESRAVAATPAAYRAYIQSSRGEFSCAKPSCSLLQNAWVSDRTLCYLASGKPAVLQHTGPSRLLPDGAGLFRFHTVDQARQALAAVAADYDHHCRAARALAEELFAGTRVVQRVLERALP